MARRVAGGAFQAENGALLIARISQCIAVYAHGTSKRQTREDGHFLMDLDRAVAYTFEERRTRGGT
jgi:hypothetical protein